MIIDHSQMFSNELEIRKFRCIKSQSSENVRLQIKLHYTHYQSSGFSDRPLEPFALALFSWTLPLPVLYQNPSIMCLMNGFDLAIIQTFERHQLAYGNSDC